MSQGFPYQVPIPMQQGAIVSSVMSSQQPANEVQQHRQPGGFSYASNHYYACPQYHFHKPGQYNLSFDFEHGGTQTYRGPPAVNETPQITGPAPAKPRAPRAAHPKRDKKAAVTSEEKPEEAESESQGREGREGREGRVLRSHMKY